jgi:hypothetical protein
VLGEEKFVAAGTRAWNAVTRIFVFFTAMTHASARKNHYFVSCALLQAQLPSLGAIFPLLEFLFLFLADITAQLKLRDCGRFGLLLSLALAIAPSLLLPVLLAFIAFAIDLLRTPAAPLCRLLPAGVTAVALLVFLGRERPFTALEKTGSLPWSRRIMTTCPLNFL